MKIDLFYEFDINEDNLWKIFFFDMEDSGLKIAFDRQEFISENMLFKDKLCIGGDFIKEYAEYLNKEKKEKSERQIH